MRRPINTSKKLKELQSQRRKENFEFWVGAIMFAMLVCVILTLTSLLAVEVM